MKKLKIMLLSILVLGGVAGALAFKAKLNDQICFVNPRDTGSGLVCTISGTTPLDCTSQYQGTTTTSGTQKCTVLKDADKDCPQMKCPNLTYTTTIEL